MAPVSRVQPFWDHWGPGVKRPPRPHGGRPDSLDSPRHRGQLPGSVRVLTVDLRAHGGRKVVKPISPRSRDPRRLGVLALALFQFNLFAALPAVDAVLEARGPSAERHIENENDEHGDTGHSHLLCQLTRTLSSGDSPPIPNDLPLVSATSTDTPAATAWENRPTPPGGSGSRAPPRA